MIPEQYVWLAWSSAFLLPWMALYVGFPRQRRPMMWASLFTAPSGLTEPLFVPEYWNPPSLFDLAQNTGFDIESLIFSFGIGGTGAVLYNLFTRQAPLPVKPMSGLDLFTGTITRPSPHRFWHFPCCISCLGTRFIRGFSPW